MTPVGFKPAISAGDQPQTYALDRAAPPGSAHLVTIFEQFLLNFVCKLNMSIHFYGNHVCALIFLVRSSNKNLQFPIMVGKVLSKNLRVLVLVSLRFSQTLNPVLFLRGC
jgi:hypothetical protein